MSNSGSRRNQPSGELQPSPQRQAQLAAAFLPSRVLRARKDFVTGAVLLLFGIVGYPRSLAGRFWKPVFYKSLRKRVEITLEDSGRPTNPGSFRPSDRPWLPGGLGLRDGADDDERDRICDQAGARGGAEPADVVNWSKSARSVQSGLLFMLPSRSLSQGAGQGLSAGPREPSAGGRRTCRRRRGSGLLLRARLHGRRRAGCPFARR